MSLKLERELSDIFAASDARRAHELRDEWLPRPFALSPPSYFKQPYPGTKRAQLMQALKEHAESEKEME